jgi:hypothetical protein
MTAESVTQRQTGGCWTIDVLLYKWNADMGLILLEALVALLVLVFIVWWTMFAGRQGGEPQAHDAPSDTEPDQSSSRDGGASKG